MKNVLVVIACCVCFVSSVCADLLIPPTLIAKKSPNAAKEAVFSWTNSDKYTCDTPVTLFFENADEAKAALSQCPGKSGFLGYIKADNIEIYGKRYKKPNFSSTQKKIVAFFPDEIKICPTDKPLLDNYGVCHSCDDDDPIDVSWMVGTYFNIREFRTRVTYFCSTICPNRHIEEEQMKKGGNENNYFCVKEGWKPWKPERRGTLGF